MAQEKEEAEREKWEILKKAQETSERCVDLKSELEQKNLTIKKLEVELAEVTRIHNHVNELLLFLNFK